MPNGTHLSFDRLVAIFDDQRALPPAAVAALHGVFGELVGAGLETMVEPGAGTGRIAIPALAAGFHVTALDISNPMLDALQDRLDPVPELAGRCEVIVGDATALPFADDRFDAGVLAQVLYLIPDWRRALDDLARVVRPGGRVLLVQERTSMSPALATWDAAWREATVRAGHVALSQEPDDHHAVGALAERVGKVEARVLASWPFGQTVVEALTGLDRLRPLYELLDDATWNHALSSFHAWHAGSGFTSETRLDGTVALTLVEGSVPANS